MIKIIKNKKIKKLIIALGAVSLFIIIILVPLRLNIYNIETYKNLYEKNNVFNDVNQNDALKLTSGIIKLLKNGENIERFALKSSFSFFTDDEISHLYDVRLLIQKILMLLYISMMIFFIFILLLFQKRFFLFLKDVSLVFIFSSCFTILLIVLLYFFGTNFITLFEGFHQIFFPQGNWAFPEDSLLITLLPLNFFYEFFTILLKASLLTSVILLALGLSGFIISSKKHYKVLATHDG